MTGTKTKFDTIGQPANTGGLGARLMGAAALAFLCLAVPHGALAQATWTCSNSTLKGQYGALVQGIRPALVPPPQPMESFVAIALRNFDGKGGFVEEAASQHGVVSGPFPTLATPAGTATGTYQVNADCTGTSTLTIVLPSPAPPLVIVSDFVITDNGKGINEIVTLPKTNVVTAVYTRK
jgi:hypothetical protein